MEENLNEVTLCLHECYSPTIKVFVVNQYLDINDRGYYKALFTDNDGIKRGFIVREEFLSIWQMHLIAEIRIKKTNNGATLIAYETFDSVAQKRNVEFVEVNGVFISGIYEVAIGENQAKRLIYFVPSYPNRFSFSRKTYNADNRQRFKRLYVKCFSEGRLSIILNSLLYSTKEEYNDASLGFILLRRTKIENADDAENDYSNTFVSNSSIVYKIDYRYHERRDEFILEGWDDFELSPELHEPIKEYIIDSKNILIKECEYINAVKKIINRVTYLGVKIEYSFPYPFCIRDLELKKHFYNLKGAPYIASDLCLGLERNHQYKIEEDEMPLDDADYETVNISIEVIISI